MSFPFIPIAGGLALATWGPKLWAKLRTAIYQVRGEIELDPELSEPERRDVLNLLENVSNPKILEGAVLYYRGRGMQIASQLLFYKLEAIKKG